MGAKIFSTLKKHLKKKTHPNSATMLENVFQETRLIPGTKQLCHKYCPENTSELCTAPSEIEEMRLMLASQRYFVVRGTSGNGATITARLVCKEAGCFAHDLSCGQGCAEVLRVLKQNMAHVLLALQSQKARVVYLLKDIECLNKSERSQILRCIEDNRINCVCICNPNTTCAWPEVRISPPESYAKLVHLCWIMAMEEMTVDMDLLYRLADYEDFRYAINCMQLPEASRRDSFGIEDFQKILYANETLQSDLDHILVFEEYVCAIDMCEFKPTRDWFIEIAADHVDRHFQYGRKQTFVARHAQFCHRNASLNRACNSLGIVVQDMCLYSDLYKKHLLNGQVPPFSRHVSDYEYRAKSLYTIAKMNAKASQCKQLKKALQI